MKKIADIARLLLLIILLVCYTISNVYSQGTDIRKGTSPGLFLEIGFSGSKSGMNNEMTGDLQNVSPQEAHFNQFSILGGYFFSGRLGISTGIGFNSYGAIMKLSSYFNESDALDDEHEAFKLSVVAIDISEQQKINSLEIPLNLILKMPLSRKFSFYVRPGMSISFPLTKTYDNTGTFTFKGYYPAYNITLENIPSHNFPEHEKVYDNGELMLKGAWINAKVSGGCEISVMQRIHLLAGVLYVSSLSDISGFGNPADFKLSTGYPEINSLLGSSGSITRRSLSLTVTLRYYFLKRLYLH